MSTSRSFSPLARGLSQQGRPPQPSRATQGRSSDCHPLSAGFGTWLWGGGFPPCPTAPQGGFHPLPPSPPTVTSRKSSASPHPPPPSRGCQTGARPPPPPSASPGGRAFSRPWHRAPLRKLLTQRVARRPASDVSLESGPGSGGAGGGGCRRRWARGRSRVLGAGRRAGPRGRQAATGCCAARSRCAAARAPVSHAASPVQMPGAAGGSRLPLTHQKALLCSPGRSGGGVRGEARQAAAQVV